MNLSDYRFVLDRMLAENYPMPLYVTYHKKEATASGTSTPSYHPTDYPVTSQENVWLSHLKLACNNEMRPMVREIWMKKVADAASRYGIMKDIESVTAYVEKLRTKVAGIETQSDYEKAKDWLFKNAEFLDTDTAAAVSEHLQQVAKKLGHVLSMTEQYRLDELSGRDPMTPEIMKQVDARLHKLATGSVYTSNQFLCLPVEAVQEYLPDLMKTASLGMNVMPPQRFGKIAETLGVPEAEVLDTLMGIHGEQPIHSDYGCPLEINDEVLAKL